MCATFHFSNLHLIAEILKLSPDSELPSSLLNQLQQNIPIFFEIFTKIGYIPKSFFPILDIIQKCVEATFTGDVHVQSSQVSDQESLPLACYPSMPAVCKRGRYEADCRKPVGSCKKTGARHPSLLPGIFTVFCPHGMTYGFGFKQLLINNIKKKLKHLRIQNFEVTICEVKGYDTYK